MNILLRVFQSAFPSSEHLIGFRRANIGVGSSQRNLRELCRLELPTASVIQQTDSQSVESDT